MKILILLFVCTILMHCQVVYVKSPEYVEGTETVIIVTPPPPPPVIDPPQPIRPIHPQPVRPRPQPVKEVDNNFGKRPDRPEFERPERKKTEIKQQVRTIKKPEIEKKVVATKQTEGKPVRPAR